MRRILMLLVVLSLLSCSSSQDEAAPAFDISGRWIGTWTDSGTGRGSLFLVLVQDGKNISGSLQADGVPCCRTATVSGSMIGDQITLNAVFAAGVQVDYSGTGSTDGKKVSGRFTATARWADGAGGTWEIGPYMPEPPAACIYTYSDWGPCVDGRQTRTVIKAEPRGCTGTPVLEQACGGPPSPSTGNLPPTAPTYTGETYPVEGCYFDITLSATDPDGSVASYLQTGGVLPPGHALVGNVISSAAPDVRGALGGRNRVVIPVMSWTSSFAAVDNLGLQGPSSSLTLTCLAAQ